MESMPTLRVWEPVGERVWPLEGEMVTFGRSPECNLVLEADGVSRRHGRFVCEADGAWYVEDTRSKNGILLNGQRVTRHRLSNRDILTIGERNVLFCDEPCKPAARAVTTLPAVTIADIPEWPHSSQERAAGSMEAMDARRLAALYQISRQLMGQREVEQLLDLAAGALMGILDAQVVVFGLTRDPQREPEKLVVLPRNMAVQEITLSGSVLQRTLSARRAVLVADTRSDLDLHAAHSIVLGNICSAMCVPMMREQEVTGFIYVDQRRRGRSYDDRDLEFACAVGAMVGTAIENARLYEAELARQKMVAELAGARKVQESILPSVWPELPGWDVHGEQRPSLAVGGDYYDAIVTPDGRLWLVIADVSGKGVPAALLAASMHAGVHAFVGQCRSPAELMTRLNALLLRREFSASFVTCLAAVITPASGEVVLASAGHPYPVHVGPVGDAHIVHVDSTLMLGVEHEVTYEDTRWAFPETGGSLLMYTDGITEAFDPTGKPFGGQRLVEVVAACRTAPAAELISCVRARIEDFRGAADQSDDLTLLACRRV